MTPHLRRLTTAVAVLLVTTFLVAFGVGRVTSPSEADTKAARSMSELTAYTAAEHEAFLRAKGRGYAAGLVNGRTVGRRAGQARGEAMRAATQTTATHPHVQPALSTDGGEEGCCPSSSGGSQTYVSQDGSTGDGGASSQEMVARGVADSSRARETPTSGDEDSVDRSDSSSWPSDPDTTLTASAESVAAAQRPQASERNWAEADGAGGAADEANHAQDADKACDVEEGEEAEEDHDTDEADEETEADEEYDTDEADEA